MSDDENNTPQHRKNKMADGEDDVPPKKRVKLGRPRLTPDQEMERERKMNRERVALCNARKKLKEEEERMKLEEEKLRKAARTARAEQEKLKAAMARAKDGACTKCTTPGKAGNT